MKMSSFRNKLKELFFKEAGSIYSNGLFRAGHVKTLMLKILNKPMTKKSTYTLVQRVASKKMKLLIFKTHEQLNTNGDLRVNISK